MSVNIGSYRNRIIFKKRNNEANGMGGFIVTWSEVCTIWGSFIQINAKESFYYKQIYPTAEFKIQCRYRPDLNSNMRIFYNNKYYDITGVIDKDNLHKELTILCEELKNA